MSPPISHASRRVRGCNRSLTIWCAPRFRRQSLSGSVNSGWFLACPQRRSSRPIHAPRCNTCSSPCGTRLPIRSASVDQITERQEPLTSGNLRRANDQQTPTLLLPQGAAAGLTLSGGGVAPDPSQENLKGSSRLRQHSPQASPATRRYVASYDGRHPCSSSLS